MTDLFLLPFAGGTSLTYRDWTFPQTVNVIPLDYKGHGFRMKERLCDTFEEMVCDIAEQVRQKSQGNDIAVFGHSMGGLVAWDAAGKLEDEGIRISHVIISACLPPHLFSEKKYSVMATDAWLKDFLTTYGRIRPEKMESAFFRKTLYPAIRNDYRLISIHPHGEIRKQSLNLACFYGRQDEMMPSEGMDQWKDYTDRRFVLQGFQGSHFYIEDESNREEVMTAIVSFIAG